MGINSLSGDLLTSTNNARNVLLRSAPAGDFEVSTTYDIWFQPWENDTQGGLIVYQDDDNYIKLVHLYNNWNKLALLEEIKGKVVYQYAIPIVDSLPIKISRVGSTYSGYYSPDGIGWRPLGVPVQANLQNVKIGLVSFSGSAPDWVTHYFDWFRVSNPCCLVGDMISLGRNGVQELQPVGTVVGMLAVSGAGSFTYSLAAGAGGEDNNSFSIAGAVLKTKVVFHRDLRDHYNIRIRATSGNGLSAEQNFVITVLPKTMLYLPLAGY
jgi:hypothetical protein